MSKGTDLIFGTISVIAFFAIVQAFFNFFGLPTGIVNTIYYGSYFVLFFAIFLTILFASGELVAALFLAALIPGSLFICLSLIVPAIA